MEPTPRYRSFSILSNLSELESFILHDPAAQNLYQQYLALLEDGKKSNHILFFSEIVSLSERMSAPTAPSIDYFRAELSMIYEQYFLDESELVLDIPRDRLSLVRRNIAKGVSLVAFKPALKAVVRDLAFIYLDGFMSSSIFKDYKDNVLVDFNLADIPQMAVKEKDSSLKLRRFFGDKTAQSKLSKRSVGDQPQHIKEYKLSKIFGERVGVEKTALIEDTDESIEISSAVKRRDRKLHVFFGTYFEIEDTLFSERVRASTIGDVEEFRKQPIHVKSFRLARFFGARPPSRRDLYNAVDACDQSSSSVMDGDVLSITMAPRNKKQHLNRFFGERMDPEKEATSVSFAVQPENVKACTLRKIFGESAAQSINFVGTEPGTWPTCRNVKSRAKLEKIFGPFQG